MENHARRLFSVFARVAAAANKGHNSRLSDDLHILIRKYLSAPDERHKVYHLHPTWGLELTWYVLTTFFVQRLAILGSLAWLRVPQENEEGMDSHALLDSLFHSCQSSSVRRI